MGIRRGGKIEYEAESLFKELSGNFFEKAILSWTLPISLIRLFNFSIGIFTTENLKVLPTWLLFSLEISIRSGRRMKASGK